MAEPIGGRPLDLITVGRSSVDLYGEQVGGRLEDMGSFAKYVGGSPTNTAVGAARLGLRAGLLTRGGARRQPRGRRGRMAPGSARPARVDQGRFSGVGDGSYLILNSEIATSVMLGLKLVIVLLDNRGFGCINRLQKAKGGTDCALLPGTLLALIRMPPQVSGSQHTIMKISLSR